MGGVRLHLEEVVWLVFEDEDVVLLGDGVDVAAALFALGCARGVLAGGYGVEEEGFAGAAGLLVPGAEDRVHAMGEESLLVHLDGDTLDTQGRGCFDGCYKGVFFGHDVVAAGSEH